MSESEVSPANGYVEFVELFKLQTLEDALSAYKSSKQHDAILRYYAGCVAADTASELLEPLRLLQQALASLTDSPGGRRRRSTEPAAPVAEETKADAELTVISNRIDEYATRLANSVEQLNASAREVVKLQHFVWLGGGIGDIQRDYINVWTQVLGPEGYAFKLWYDSDALLVHETNRIVVEAAKADAMAAGGASVSAGYDLADLYEARLEVLKLQLFEHVQAGKSGADEARIDLLVRAYGQDETRLRELRQKNLVTLPAMNQDFLRLVDVREKDYSFPLVDIYERELNMRGNLAAAGDVLRYQVLFNEGGTYSDVDYLPPFKKMLGEVHVDMIRGDKPALAVLQLILDRNPHFMPGRQALRDRYNSYAEDIPAELLPEIEAFAASGPLLKDVFAAPEPRVAIPDALRAAYVDNSALSNAFLIAHAGAASLEAVTSRVRFMYELMDQYRDALIEQRVPALDVDTQIRIATDVIVGAPGFNELPREIQHYLQARIQDLLGYFGEGVTPNAKGTIHLTGPGVMRTGMSVYEAAHFTPRAAAVFSKQAKLQDGFNYFTEEEQDHSWHEKFSDFEQWRLSEQKKSQEGVFKARYVGDVAELLKRQSIEFDEGWPVIEGRYVLATDILQDLAEGLGEPFLRAMREGFTGTVGFARLVPLGFDQRQAIVAQKTNVFAPASGATAETRDLPLDEFLQRYAKGTFGLEQLSPCQRLLLGSLLGAPSLDKHSFEALVVELDNLANGVSELGISNRYAVIERELFKRQAPAFLAGLKRPPASPPAHDETALALKKYALEQPLTLSQWGEHVARIQQVAKLEFRDRIVERLSDVLDSFHGADTKLVPQDLLLEGAGDTIGGRCYPLALVMAAALHQGADAMNTLRERFYLGVIEPSDRDSMAFLQVLEELRDESLADSGSALERSTLEQVVGLLEDADATRTIMLNSDNHAMLVAKTRTGEGSAYHFYDPNFGVFEFAQAQPFREALERFFIEHEMARHYATFGELSAPTFDLIELNAERVGALVVPSGLQVNELLAPGALRERPLLPGRQRLTSARGQSLVNNINLGNSLRDLDGHWWAQQIEQATRRLQIDNQLTASFAPVFDSLEVTPTGDYHLSLVNLEDPQQWVKVTTRDHGFLRIKQFLSERFASLARQPVSAGSPPDPTEAGSVHTLNAGFTIQALMHALRSREGDTRELTMAVRLHAYINYAQLLHGNLVDIAGVIQLVRQALAQEKLIAQTSTSVIGEALGHAAGEGVGAVLGLANVGFDIYQLSEAGSDAEKARFGTQLAFDSASLLVTGSGLIAAAAGAGTAAAVLGGAGVILGGLAIGVGALVEGFAGIFERARQVGLFFYEFDKAVRQGGYRLDPQSKAWTAHASLVVESVDLLTGQLRLGSPQLFPLRDHFGVPDYEVDFTRSVDIRQGLELPQTLAFSPQAGDLIVLPCTPKTWYGYGYKAFPFANEKHAEGFDLARRLEEPGADGKRRFLFSFYSFPSEYLVADMAPVYKPSSIEVRLDTVERTLVVPVLPKNWHGLISYDIEGCGAPCTLLLNPGVSLSFAGTHMATTRWTLLASWATQADVSLSGDRLDIGEMSLCFDDVNLHEVSLKLADQVLRIDFTQQTLLLVSADLQPGMMDPRTLHGHFKKLAHEHRLALPYTPVHNYRVPFEDPGQPRDTTAFYDAREDRFIYIRDEDLPLADEAQLGMVMGQDAFFYQPDSFLVWQVDVVTGLISHHYRLLASVTGSRITRCEPVAGGAVQVTQEIPRAGQAADVLSYLIRDGEVYLTSLVRGPDSALQALFSATPTLSDWSLVLGEFYKLREREHTATAVVVNWQPAPIVSVCWAIDSNQRDMAWVRHEDRLIIRPPARRHHARGWADSIKNMQDLLLIVPSGGQQDLFVVYDKLHKRLLRLQRNQSAQAGAHWSQANIWVDGLQNILATDHGYVALSENGLCFDVTNDGQLALSGLAESWFKQRPEWWTHLAEVAAQHPVTRFALLGLSNAAGDAKLCAWYVDDRLLLADLGPGAHVRLLGFTPDRQAAWLFEVDSGVIYRQGFIAADRLSAAFGQRTRLLQADRLPAPQRRWVDWHFIDVTAKGAELRGVTAQGLMLTLQQDQPALLTGVESQWVSTHEDRLLADLAALANSHRHVDFLSVDTPQKVQWYVAASGQLLGVDRALLQPSSALLGTRQQGHALMIHDPARGVVQAFPGETRIGPLPYARRDTDVMTLEGQQLIGDVLPLLPDDVKTLVLRLGQGAVTYRLSRGAWLRLDSLVLDCRPALAGKPAIPGKLIWELDDPGKLLLSIVGEHLVLIEPDSGHAVIIREACAADVSLRGEVVLAFAGYRSLLVSALVAAIADLGAAATGVSLEELVGRATNSVEVAPADLDALID
jgi:insecticidal toxin